MTTHSHGSESGPRHVRELLNELIALWPHESRERLHREVARCADVEDAA